LISYTNRTFYIISKDVNTGSETIIYSGKFIINKTEKEDVDTINISSEQITTVSDATVNDVQINDQDSRIETIRNVVGNTNIENVTGVDKNKTTAFESLEIPGLAIESQNLAQGTSIL